MTRLFALIVLSVPALVFASWQVGFRPGYELLSSRDSGSSTAYKFQGGFGAAWYLRGLFWDRLAVEAEAGGVYSIGPSDSLGGYLYPEKTEIPFALRVGYFQPFELGTNMGLSAGILLGVELPYRITATYYAPRVYEPGASLGLEASLDWKAEGLSLGVFTRYSLQAGSTGYPVYSLTGGFILSSRIFE